MTVQVPSVITTAHVLTLSITSAVVVDQGGQANYVTSSWDPCVIRLITTTLMCVRMEVFVAILQTKTTTHAHVSLATLDATVRMNLILVKVIHASKEGHAPSLVQMTSNVIVHQVSSLNYFFILK